MHLGSTRSACQAPSDQEYSSAKLKTPQAPQSCFVLQGLRDGSGRGLEMEKNETVLGTCRPG